MEKFLLVILFGIVAISGYLLYSGNQEPIDIQELSPESQGIEIVHQGYGDEYGSLAADTEKEDIGEVMQALDLIERYSPEDYEMVNKYVNVIELVPASLKMHDNRCFPSIKKIQLLTIVRLCLNYCDEPYGQMLTKASTIVHEACHSMRYHTGKESALRYAETGSSMEEERACQNMQHDFMDRVAPKLSAEEAM